jgi:hypothetical protein
VTRYAPLAARSAARIQTIDVRCPRCFSPPGRGCRKMRWLPERVVVEDGRVRSLPPGAVVTDVKSRDAHEERRELARREDARLRSGRRAR